MERRYQVFVSSTFEDLKAEREGVLRALLTVDCFPSSMEGFGAASSTPWDIITSTIDLCDYYLLITAGKYGSLDEAGISYTEKEYDYALSKGIPCLAFVHSDLNKLPADKVDIDLGKREKLKLFQMRVSNAHLFERWNGIDDLKYKVVASLTKEMRRNPRSGWVKASNAAESDVLRKLDDARTENDQLRRQLSAVSDRDPLAVLARASETQAIFIPPLEKTRQNEADVISYFSNNPLNLSALHVLKTIGDFLYTPSDEHMLLYRIGQRMETLIGKSTAIYINSLDKNLPRSINYGILIHCLKLLDRLGVLKAESIMVEGRSPQTHWSLSDLGRSVYAHLG